MTDLAIGCGIIVCIAYAIGYWRGAMMARTKWMTTYDNGEI